MKNNGKKMISLLLAVLMTASLSVTAFAAEEGTLSASNLTEDKTLTYTIVSEKVFTDMSGVKLSWSVPVVTYEENTATVWNTATLQWEQKVNKTNNTADAKAAFTLVNRGSKKVTASVSFALDGSHTAGAASVAFDKNDVPLGTIVGTDANRTLIEGGAALLNRDASVKDGCKTTITGTISLSADKLSADSGKLGTYTVSIAAVGE